METNLSITSTPLNNNHNYIDYHWYREALDTGMTSMAHINDKSNPYDLITELLNTHKNYYLMTELLVKAHLRLKGGSRKLGLNSQVMLYHFYPGFIEICQR